MIGEQISGNLIIDNDGDLIPIKLEPRYCLNCGQPLSMNQIRRDAIYCSSFCNNRANIERKGSYYVDGKLLPSGITGAIHELIVCSNLMENGYYVFRSQSPVCPCDLIAMKGSRLFKIEVTTGRKCIRRLSYPKKHEGYIYDYIAIVTLDHSITWRDRQDRETLFPKSI
jgi:hypothetical protein